MCSPLEKEEKYLRLVEASVNMGKVRNFVAAVCQLNSTADATRNLEQCRVLVKRAKEEFNAELVCLPEGFSFIGENRDQTLSIAEPIPGPLIEEYSRIAKENSIFLSLGGFQELGSEPVEHADSNSINSAKKVKNTHLIIDPDGKILAKYSKVHLFDIDLPSGVSFRESSYTERGNPNELIVCETPLANLGLSIVAKSSHILSFD